ncbi:ABC transporter ATP-binding protein [Marinivivus vitaminiproducens]|uniref:ABC transporter ATP-binding protein n=1 Tax=Marinivivus vitaminiproducens TaxID=3035935 RepID=UPI0027988E2F|nr:ABC transporter ATP-binding protein [Geminicoccaceae bacterium SCSIO 64248]
MLAVEGIQAGYGGSQVLFDVGFTVEAGEVVALLGRNGMGKTTTVRALTGLLPLQAGSVRMDGHELAGRPPFVRARAGLGLVPEGRQVFLTLSVTENLVATARGRGWTQARVFGLFPRLAERKRHQGSQLSGGEQQMLAIGRALMTNPRLLILDEATEGLAPLVRAEIWACLRDLKAEGQAILVIDKNLKALAALADHHVVIEKGRVAWTGTSDALAADPGTVERFLHV